MLNEVVDKSVHMWWNIKAVTCTSLVIELVTYSPSLGKKKLHQEAIMWLDSPQAFINSTQTYHNH